MCYHILTQKGAVVSRSTVQRVTNLECEKSDVKELFVRFDVEIHCWLKSDEKGYEGSKTDPKDWSDLLEEDPDFATEFNKIFNNSANPEADNSTDEFVERVHFLDS